MGNFHPASPSAIGVVFKPKLEGPCASARGEGHSGDVAPLLPEDLMRLPLLRPKSARTAEAAEAARQNILENPLARSTGKFGGKTRP